MSMPPGSRCGPQFLQREGKVLTDSSPGTLSHTAGWEVGHGEEAAPAWDSPFLTWGVAGWNVPEPISHWGDPKAEGEYHEGHGHDSD